MNATIILLDGSTIDLRTWQARYNLTVGSSQIGRYFNIGEPSFLNGLTLSEGVIRLLDVIRFIRNRPTIVNSLDRSRRKQQELISKGFRAAKFSPHEVKLAVDIDTVSEEDTKELVDIIEEAAEILGYQVRMGYMDYLEDGNTFVHVDICPMYYRPGKPWHNDKHPKVWEAENKW